MRASTKFFRFVFSFPFSPLRPLLFPFLSLIFLLLLLLLLGIRSSSTKD